MKKKIVLMTSMLLWLVFLCACDNNENNPTDFIESQNETSLESSIIGTWELKTLSYPDGNREISSDQRDIFMFNQNGKVKVFIKKGKPLHPDLPNEEGEYDYSYDMEKQIIQLCGETLKCTISGGEMHMEGYHYGPDDGLYVHEYIFIKK